ncbi:MAG: hypothetical protein WA418_30070 [Bradyrhizobium sp.]
MRVLDEANVAVEVLKTECKLVGIDGLGAAIELTLDLGVTVVDRSGNVAHQALQKLRIEG